MVYIACLGLPSLLLLRAEQSKIVQPSTYTFGLPLTTAILGYFGLDSKWFFQSPDKSYMKIKKFQKLNLFIKIANIRNFETMLMLTLVIS